MPSVTSRLCTGIVTVAVGAVFRTTLNVSATPAPALSAVAAVVRLTVNPGRSSSAFVTAIVTSGTSRYVASSVEGSTDSTIV